MLETKKEITHKIIQFLALREHSAHEIQKKCAPKVLDLELLASVIAELIKKDLISDERFTESYIQMRYRKGFGYIRIKQELTEKGISSLLIEQYLILEDEKWQISMINVLTKKYKTSSNNLDYKEKAKRARFLEYRGFPTQLIADYLF